MKKMIFAMTIAAGIMTASMANAQHAAKVKTTKTTTQVSQTTAQPANAAAAVNESKSTNVKVTEKKKRHGKVKASVTTETKKTTGSAETTKVKTK